MAKSTPKKPAISKATSAGDELDLIKSLLKKSRIDDRTLATFAHVDGKPIFTLKADGAAAIKLWEKLRKLVNQTGYWPVVMGALDRWEPNDLADSPKIEATWAAHLKKLTGRTPGKKRGVTGMLLQAAEEFDTDAWLRKNAGEAPGAQDDEWAEMAEAGGFEMPKTPPNTKFRAVFDVLSNKPLKGLTVGLWPTRESWQAPICMRFGGWNACPYPHEQAAILRRWKEKYDAELVVCAGDVVELRVGKPPKTDAAALELAREQYAFCDDIVNQGTMTLERLAEALKGGTVWYFWWD